MEDNKLKLNVVPNSCPQCKKSSSETAYRLVRDACGHQKCRVCLILDENKCQQCQNLSNNNTNNNVEKIERQPNESVIKYEGVITSNNTVKTEYEPQTNTNNNVLDVIINNSKGKNGIKKQQQRKRDKLKIPSHIIVTKDPIITYKCQICNKQFTTNFHVKYHMHCAGGKLMEFLKTVQIIKNVIVPKPYRCTKCSKEFITRTHLQIHTLGHGDKKPFLCNICNKSFNSKYKLRRHSILHTKPFICTECGKTFGAKESLKLHTLIHRGEKPYKCKECNATFNNSSNLNRHLITHSKEKDHMCDQCGKRFTLEWSLIIHRRSHQRIRPFECNKCFKTFVNNKDLQRHQLIHLEKKVFKCTFCSTNFRRKDNLYRHVKNSHPGKTIIDQKTVKQLIESPALQQKQQQQPSIVKTTKPIVDNPNAIKVITVSPYCNKTTTTTTTTEKTTTTDRSDNRSVIIAPLKLAFKTTKFKNCYNINREYNLQESVNICQKILTPDNGPSSLSLPPPPPPPLVPLKSTIKSEPLPTSTEICEKILSPYKISRPHYETSFEHKKHAIIKNIKFKLPANYTNLVKNNNNNSSALNDDKKSVNILHSDSKTFAELKNVSTSVIVNSQMDPSNMHWRRRTSQNLSLKMD